ACQSRLIFLERGRARWLHAHLYGRPAPLFHGAAHASPVRGEAANRAWRGLDAISHAFTVALNQAPTRPKTHRIGHVTCAVSRTCRCRTPSIPRPNPHSSTAFPTCLNRE